MHVDANRDKRNSRVCRHQGDEGECLAPDWECHCPSRFPVAPRSSVADETCDRCGQYMPPKLDGTARVHHDCGRTPPCDGLPPNVYACPVCGGHARFRYGCWGTRENPHPHAYMRAVHELVRARLGAT